MLEDYDGLEGDGVLHFNDFRSFRVSREKWTEKNASNECMNTTNTIDNYTNFSFSILLFSRHEESTLMYTCSNHVFRQPFIFSVSNFCSTFRFLFQHSILALQ